MLSLLTTAPARPATATADAGTPAHRPDNDSGAGFAQALQRSSDAMNTPARTPERGTPAASAAERRADPGNTREATAAHGPDSPARPAAEGAHAGPDTGPDAGHGARTAGPGHTAEADDAGPGTTGARWRRGGRAGTADAPGNTDTAARRRTSLGTEPGDTDATTTLAGDASDPLVPQDTAAPDLAALAGAALPGAPLPGSSTTPATAAQAQTPPPAAQDSAAPRAEAGTPRDARPPVADAARNSVPGGAAAALLAGERALSTRSTLGLAEAGAAARRSPSTMPALATAATTATTAANAASAAGASTVATAAPAATDTATAAATPGTGDAPLAPLPGLPSAATTAPQPPASADIAAPAGAAPIEATLEQPAPTAGVPPTGPRPSAAAADRPAVADATSAESVMLAGTTTPLDSTRPPPPKPEGERRLARSAEPRLAAADPALAAATGQPQHRDGVATGLPARADAAADRPGPRGTPTGPAARTNGADSTADLATRAAAGEAVARAAGQAGREQAHADTQARGEHLAASVGTPISADTAAGTPLRFGEQLQALMPAAQAPGHSAAQPATARIAVPMQAPDFAPALGSQVTLFARDGIQHARIELNPAEMGPISVQIVLDGSAAKVDFHAEAALTRQAIESSLPSLAGALRDAGLTLAGGGVFQQPSGQQNGQHNGAQGGQGSGSARGPRDAGEADAGTTPATVLRTSARRGLVDLVA